MIKILTKKLNKLSITPKKNHDSDAGWDLFSVEKITLQPHSQATIPLGISTLIPEGYCALIWDRSGMGSRGIHRLAGVIDSAYRGEWKVVLANLTDSPYEIRHGDKIAQALIQKVESVSFVEAEELSYSERGESGFGSSGR